MSETGERSGSQSSQSVLMALFLVVLVVTTLWLFTQRQWWRPVLASVHGASIDRVFTIILGISGVLFVLLQLVVAICVFRFGSHRLGRPKYRIDHKLEKRFALVAGLIILSIDVSVFAMGEGGWYGLWNNAPGDAAVVEVTGEQFMWNFRYPGPDGILGRTKPSLISSTNTLGVDPNDPASKDDVLSINQLHLVADKPIKVVLRSKDVIHSFYLPNLRVKQDAVPGMRIELWFVPTKEGRFEVMCSQICGHGHYRMRAFLTVESKDGFEKWLSGMTPGGV